MKKTAVACGVGCALLLSALVWSTVDNCREGRTVMGAVLYGFTGLMKIKMLFCIECRANYKHLAFYMQQHYTLSYKMFLYGHAVFHCNLED